MLNRKNTNISIPQSRLAADKYAYMVLESLPAGGDIIEAIEADLRNGLTPAKIGSIWRRDSNFENMSRMVEMAANHIERISE